MRFKINITWPKTRSPFFEKKGRFRVQNSKRVTLSHHYDNKTHNIALFSMLWKTATNHPLIFGRAESVLLIFFAIRGWKISGMDSQGLNLQPKIIVLGLVPMTSHPQQPRCNIWIAYMKCFCFQIMRGKFLMSALQKMLSKLLFFMNHFCVRQKVKQFWLILKYFLVPLVEILDYSWGFLATLLSVKVWIMLWIKFTSGNNRFKLS